jgi:hypothetical protein
MDKRQMLIGIESEGLVAMFHFDQKDVVISGATTTITGTMGDDPRPIRVTPVQCSAKFDDMLLLKSGMSLYAAVARVK